MDDTPLFTGNARSLELSPWISVRRDAPRDKIEAGESAALPHGGPFVIVRRGRAVLVEPQGEVVVHGPCGVLAVAHLSLDSVEDLEQAVIVRKRASLDLHDALVTFFGLLLIHFPLALMLGAQTTESHAAALLVIAPLVLTVIRLTALSRSRKRKSDAVFARLPEFLPLGPHRDLTPVRGDTVVTFPQTR